MKRRGWLLDSATVLLAMAIVLSVLDDSFTPRTYLITGLVPVALLLGLALLLAGREAGGWAFLATSILLYAPVGAVVALRDPGPLIVPSRDAMGRTLGATISGPLELVGTLPPVDATGEVMLVPFVIGYLAGGAAAWLALGTTRALAPTLPILAGLGGAIGLGSLVPDHLVLRSAVLAGVLVWWVAVRSRRIQRAVRAGRGAASQAILSAVVIAVVSALAVVLVPDDNEVDRVLLRGRLDPALDVEQLSDPLAPGLSSRRARQELLLRTSGVPSGLSLRFAAMDTYTDAGWVAAGESPGAGVFGRFQRLGSKVAPIHGGTEVDVRVRVQPAYVSDWLPTLGELTSLELDYTNGRTQLSEVRYNQATSTALVVGGVDPRDDYTFTSVVTPTRLGRRVEPARATGEQLQPDGAFIDRYLPRRSRRAEDPMTALRAFMDHLVDNGRTRLRGGESTDLTPRELGRGLLGETPMVGTPHQYAAVVALAASRLGIPGRLVVGAEPDPSGRVFNTDVTSWVEIQAADGTWRRVEQEDYLGGQRLQGPAPLPGRDGAAGTVGPGRPGMGDDFDLPKGAEVDLPPGTEIPPPERDPRWMLVWALGGALGLVLLLLLLAPVLKAVRRGVRRRRASWSARYVGGWQEVIDAARDLGAPVPEHLGRVPQARLLGRGQTLAHATEVALFAPDAPSAAEERAFWEAVVAERHRGLENHRTHRRIWAWFNPASLLRSWRRSRTA